MNKTDTLISKKEIRKKYLLMRKQLTSEDVLAKSKAIVDRIVMQSCFNDASIICLYMPIRNEVDVSLIIEIAFNQGKKVFLPKVHGDEMDFYLYDKNMPLKKGPYDILEPASEQVLTPTNDTLIVCPGAVFSYKGDRIGYGGGYYDKYLSRYSMVNTVAVAYEFQVLPEIPQEENDHKMDYIISEENIYKKGE